LGVEVKDALVVKEIHIGDIWGANTLNSMAVQDGTIITFGSSSGVKLGTATIQKIGFWNATPVVQQILATGTGKTVDNVITLLQTLGLCRQS